MPFTCVCQQNVSRPQTLCQLYMWWQCGTCSNSIDFLGVYSWRAVTALSQIPTLSICMYCLGSKVHTDSEVRSDLTRNIINSLMSHSNSSHKLTILHYLLTYYAFYWAKFPEVGQIWWLYKCDVNATHISDCLSTVLDYHMHFRWCKDMHAYTDLQALHGLVRHKHTLFCHWALKH